MKISIARKVAGRFRVPGIFTLLVMFGAGLTMLPAQPASAEASMTWLVQQVAAQGGADGDSFGIHEAVSGNTAVIASPDAAVNGNAGQGAVYVFTRSNGQWTQTAKLVADDGAASDGFGSSVATNGGVIFVGAPYATINGNGGQGAVYVFDNGDNGWSQTAKLVASDGSGNNNFGWSVAVSGNNIIVGAPAAHALQGIAYIFTLNDSGWTQAAELTASNGTPFCDFGYSVAISGDKALIGSQGFPGDNTYKGAAYVFQKGDSGWAEQAILRPDVPNLGDFFGIAVALEAHTALVGAYGNKYSGGPGKGAVFAFSDASGSWAQAQKITANDGKKSDYFGLYVSVDGDQAVIGAPYATIGSNTSEGSAYLFTNQNGTWTQMRKFLPSPGAAQVHFGAAAIDGNTIVVGAWNAATGGSDHPGGAYIYGLANLDLAVSAPQHISPGLDFTSQVLATNAGSSVSPAVAVTVPVPSAASFVSANATQGDCSEAGGVVSCAFGSISGNAGMATGNITFSAKGSLGDTIRTSASIVGATPALTASAETLIAENQAPVAEDGSLTVGHNASANGTLNASDPDGDGLTFSIVDPPAHGQVELNDETSGAYTYTADKGFSGQDSFTFKANDGEDDSNTAKVSVTVKAGSSGGGGASAPLGLLALLAVGALALVRRRRG